MNPSISQRILRQPLAFLITLVILILLTIFGPSEKTLGAHLSLVLLHGAWVWSGKLAFGLAALFGAAALLWHTRSYLLQLSRALAYTGLFFWLTYLPMSLWVMQLNWGGFFFDEPRWRIPFLFGVIAVLLQIGLWLFNNHWLTAASNLLYGIGLWWQLGGIQNVLHPDAAVAQSDSLLIQNYFLILLVFAVVFGAQLTFWLFERLRPAQT